MSTIVGEVSKLEGVVRAINPATGESRVLQAGDEVFAGEVIQTSGKGGIVIDMANGTLLTLGRDTQMRLDDDVAGQANMVDSGTEGAVDIAALQQAVLEGNFDALEATAAGDALVFGSASDGGVFVERIASTGQVTSGFDTTTENQTFTDVTRYTGEEIAPGVTPATPVIPTISVADAGTINEGSDASFIVTLSNPMEAAHDISLSTTLGTAEANDIGAMTVSYNDGVNDIVIPQNTDGSYTVPAGVTSLTVDVATTQDDVYEGPETFSLTAGSTLVGSDTGSATIVDDGTGTPPPGTPVDNDIPTISVADAGTINEGSDASFIVTLSNPMEAAHDISLSTTLGTAEANDIGAMTVSYNDGVNDIVITQNTDGSYTVPAGVTSLTVDVATTQDDVYEGPETFSLTAGSALVGSDTGSATIVDDGTGTPPPGTPVDNDIPTISVADAGTINEGSDASFIVTLSNPMEAAHDISLSTTLGTAEANDIGAMTVSYNDGVNDIVIPQNTDGSYTVPAGVTSLTVDVATTQDDVYEGPETFSLTAGSALVGSDTGSATIVDDGTGTPPPGTPVDNDIPTISVADAGTINEGSDASFIVTLSNPMEAAHDISLSTTLGTAEANDIGAMTVSYNDGVNDIVIPQNTDGSYTVPAGVTSLTVDVATTQDDVYEGPETFSLTAGSTLVGSDTGSATIVDDGTGTPPPGTPVDNDIPTISVADAGTINEGSDASFIVTLSNPMEAAHDISLSTTLGTAEANDIGAMTVSYNDGVNDIVITQNTDGSYTVPAGVTSLTVDVATTQDDVYEGPETFSLTAGSALVGSDTGSATIVDDGTGTPPPGTPVDNDIPTISVADAGTINEGSDASFIVTLSNPMEAAHDISLSTTLGTAEANDIGAMTVSYNDGVNDIVIPQNTDGSYTVPAGVTSLTVDVATTQDDVYEGPETFSLTAGSALVGSDTGSATIVDDGTGTPPPGTPVDNDIPTISVADAGTINEGSDASFIVTLSNPMEAAHDISLSTTLGTAEANDIGAMTVSYNDGVNDIVITQNTDGSYTVPAGVTSLTVDVATTQDDVYEGPETFSLTAGSTLVGSDTGSATIVDDGTGTPPPGTPVDNDIPTISVADAGTINEGSDASFIVTLSNPMEAAHDISLSTTLGTAEANDIGAMTVSYNDGVNDIVITQNTDGSYTVPAGVTSLTVDVVTTQDDVYEGPETFSLTAGSTLVGSDTGSATIVDDGTGTPPPGTPVDNDIPTISVADAGTINEGSDASFIVTLSNPMEAAHDISLSTTLGTAEANDIGAMTVSYNDGVNDIVIPQNTDGSYTVPAGVTSLTVDVVTTQDDVYEGPETFSLTAGSALVGSDTGSATIVDDGTGTPPPGTPVDNDIPTISVADAGTINEGSDASFIVTLSNPMEAAHDISLSTTLGTAEANDIGAMTVSYNDGVNDIVITQNTDGSYTVPAGVTSLTVDVVTTQDDVYEGPETFSLTAGSALVGSDTGSATIVDDGTGTPPPGTPVDNDIPTISVADAGTINEGSDASFIVTLSNPMEAAHDISLSTTLGTAEANDIGAMTVSYNDGVNDIVIPQNTDGSYTVPAGVTSLTVDVATTQDDVYEGPETFSLTAGSALVGSDTGSATIVDDGTGTPPPGTPVDNDIPTISVADAGTINEGSDASFIVTLSNPMEAAHDISLSTTLGTAEANDIGAMTVSYNDGVNDIVIPQNTDGSYTVPAGVTSLTVDVATTQDDVYEGPETFSLTAGSTLVGSDTGSATIVDDGTGTPPPGTPVDNDIPTISVADAGTINEGSDASFIVTLSNPMEAAHDISLSTTLGTAEANDIGAMTVSYNDGVNDIVITQNTDGSYTVPAGVTSLTVDVATTQDDVYEGPETFSLTAGSALVGSDTGSATIVDDGTGTPPPGTPVDNDIPTISVADAGTINEGSDASFIVTLSNPMEAAHDISLSTTLGTAEANDIGAMTVSYNDGVNDIVIPQNTDGSYTVPAGVTSLTVDVATTQDDVYEGPETFSLTAGSALVGSDTGSATIVDDGTGTPPPGTPVDNDIPVVSISAIDNSALEGDVNNSTIVFKVTQDNLSDFDSVVTIKPAFGDTAITDFSQISYTDVNGNVQTLTTQQEIADFFTNGVEVMIPAGSTEAPVITFTAADDHYIEQDESFSLTVQSVTNSVVSATQNSADATILDDDNAPTTIDVTARVSEEGLSGGLADTSGANAGDDTTNNTTFTGTLAQDLDGDSLSISFTAPTSTLTSDGHQIIWSGEGSNHLTGYTSESIVLGLGDISLAASVAIGDVASVEITALASTGTLELFDGNAWVAVGVGQTISNTDIIEGNLRFTPSSDANDSPLVDIGVKVSVLGGALDVDATLAIDVSEQNTIVTVDADTSGGYTVTLSGPVDHPVNSVEDTLSFDVGFVASDGYNQSTPSTLTVVVEDDMPDGTIIKADLGLDNSGIDALVDVLSLSDNFSFDSLTNTISNTLTIDLNNLVKFGADGPGSISLKTGLGWALDDEGVLVSVDGLSATIDSNNMLSLTQADILNSTLNGKVYLPVYITDADGDEVQTSIEVDIKAVISSDPDINVSDVAVSEGDIAVFDIDMQPSLVPVTMNLALADTTTEANDFDHNTSNIVLTYQTLLGEQTITANPDGSFTIPALVTGLQAKVQTTDDNGNPVYEGPEGFTLTASVGANSDSGVGTIYDDGSFIDNDIPSLSINDVSVNEDQGSMTFTVTLSNPSDFVTTVDYASSNGTATAGLDYTAVSGSLSFAPGELTKTITVPVTDDFIAEGSETLDVILSNPVNATIGDGTGLGIISDEPVPGTADTITVSLSGDTTVTEGGTANYTVTLSETAITAMDVVVVTGHVTTDNGDLVPTTMTVTVPAGSDHVDFSVSNIDDAYAEGDESYTVTLSGVTTGGGFEAVNVNKTPVETVIKDNTIPNTEVDDEVINITLTGDASVAEGGTATYTVTLDQPAATAMQVEVQTGHITTDNGDLVPTTMMVTIPAGVSSANFTVSNNEDTTAEGNEDYQVALTGNNTVGGGFETININTAPVETTIVDNDVLSISINDVTVNEDAGTMTFTVSLSTDSTTDVTFDYASADNGSALAGSDYTAVSGSGVITAGNTSTTITVPITDDYIAENPETFLMNLSNISPSVVVADAQGVGTITDEATPGSEDTITVSIDGTAIVAEGETASYTVTTDKPVVTDMTVDVAYNYISAETGDIVEGIATVTIPAGSSTSAPFNVATVDDAYLEGDEVFNVTISNPQGGGAENVVIGTAAQATTIKDGADEPDGGTGTDDTATVSISGDTSVIEGNTAAYTISVDKAPSVDMTIDVTYTYTSADSGDINTGITQVTIPAGQLSVPLNVATIDDAYAEGDEVYSVVISNPSQGGFENIVLGTDTASTTISDNSTPGTEPNDEVINVTLMGDSTVSEGGQATYTISVDQPTATAMDVEVIVGHIQTDNGDLTPVTQMVTIPQGATSIQFTVDNNDDNLTEGNELYSVALTGITSGGGFETINVNTSPVETNIIDDEGTPSLVINNVTVNEDAGTLEFTVTLSNPTTSEVTFDYASSDNSALAGSDYTAVSGSGSIAAGTTTTTITVPITDDYIKENPETFFMNLSNPSANAQIADAQGVGTITDEGTPGAEDTVTLTLSGDAQVEESTQAAYTVTADKPVVTDLTVTVTTGHITTEDGDYVAITQNVTIPAGQTSVDFTVDTIDDAYAEGSEDFTVTMSNPVGGGVENIVLGSSQVTTSIVDESSPASEDTATVSISGATSVVEGESASYTVMVDRIPTTDLIVTVQTGHITTEDGDYVPLNTTVTIPAGQTSVNFTVSTNDDALAESSEDYKVSLTGTSGGGFENTIIGVNSVTTAITDETNPYNPNDPDQPNERDSGAVLSISGSTSTIEGDAVEYTLSVTNAPVQDMDVEVSIANVTTDGDVVVETRTVTILAGQTTATFTVDNIEDQIKENTESYTVSISNYATGGYEAVELGNSSIETFITDDDEAPEVTTIPPQNDEDATAVSFDVSSFFTDDSSLTYSVTGLPPGLSINSSTGEITGSLDNSASQGGAGGVYSVTITATDGFNPPAVTSFDWTVTNPGPDAVDDGIILVAEDSFGTIIHVLDNDQDPDSDDLSIVATTNPANGSIIVNGDGTITYIPNPNYNGPDSFTYTISDGEGGIDTATVNVNVTPVNDAPTITLGDEISVSEAGLEAGGTGELADGDASNNSDTSEKASGTFTISDGDGLADITTISFDETGTNGSTATFTLGVNGIADWSDLIGQTFNTDNGTVEITSYSNGQFGYDFTLISSATNVNNADASNSFRIGVSDGESDTQYATVDINIADDTPIAYDNEVTLTEGQSSGSDGSTNLILTLDVSGSMDTAVDGSTKTRFEIARDALVDLITKYDAQGDTAVNLTLFGRDAMNMGWMTASEAVNYLDTLVLHWNDSGYTNGLYSSGSTVAVNVGGTDYLDAINSTMSVNDFVDHPASQTIAYFLSDGDPNDNASSVDSDSDSAIVNWESFISSNMDDLHVVAIGSNVQNPIYLNTIQVLADKADTSGKEYIEVTDETQLSATLSTTVVEIEPTQGSVVVDSTSGNLVDQSGADGWADVKLVSVEYNGTTYTFDATNTEFTIETAAGTVTIDNQGAYSFTSIGDVADDVVSHVTYTVQDSDGSTASADLILTTTDSSEVVAYDNTNQATVQLVEVQASESTEQLYDLTLTATDKGRGDTVTGERTFSIAEGTTGSIEFDLRVNDFEFVLGDSYTWALMKNDGSGEVIQTVTYNLPDDEFNITVSNLVAGDYKLVLTANDSGIGDKRYDLSVSLQNIDVVSTTPHSWKVQTGSVSGNVITDVNAAGEVDDKGSEGASLSIWNGTEFVDVPVSGTTVIGTYGTLEISSNGSYTYTPNADISNTGEQDSFTYKLTQPDGDSDTAQLTIDIVQPPVAPVVDIQDSNSLLGLIGVEALNLLDFGAHQTFTAFDANSNLKSVTLTTGSLLGVNLIDGGAPMTISEQLANELGLAVSYDTGGLNLLGLVSLGGSYSITITATDGGEIDNQVINELLGTVEFNQALIADLGLLTSTTITATDTTGLSDTETVGNLIDVNLLDNSIEDNGIYEGTTGDDTLVGTSDSDRIYGYEGNDTLSGGEGNDLLRGGAGDDMLDGGAGNDLLYGGEGDDILTGGTGADVFVIEPDSTGGSTTITDYNKAEGDVLDLSEVIDDSATEGTLEQYLNFTNLDADGNEVAAGDANAVNTKITVDSNGSASGGDISTIYLDNQVIDNINDLNIDFQND
ncbi:hypothetical protein THMIRHAM_01070 [Thiomicrorhabdus immobilis]|uniref:VWFA domain-containing protein n=1 Tax=Thiomicrorhabdus immobilis TaxID=2791037 RepID=A0ABM7MAF1_9GAMM|nr:retention module-containing protein [Thiomicrorhabdus immobilis]BCN92322.1 hypothetical protein THMIRHAM_01070 [Thiomicrorhabdus immobilis]